MPRVAASPPDLKTQAGRLRWARENADIPSARGAAERFGWNENTYKSHEQGIRGAEGIKSRHLEKYARAFRVNLAWLSHGIGSPDAPELTADQVEMARRFLKAMEGP